MELSESAKNKCGRKKYTMGRKNGSNAKPQGPRFIRSHLPANRELRIALRQPTPKSFGIRRPLSPEFQAPIIETLERLQTQEDIPKKVELRKSLHVTLLSARAVGRQMMRGIVAGYELGKKGEEVRDKAANDSHRNDLPVEKGSIRVYQGYSVYMGIESPEIIEEIIEIHRILGAHGIKGFAKPENKLGLHISLGETKQSERMSKTEQRHVEHIVQEQLSTTIPENVLLGGWQVYP